VTNVTLTLLSIAPLCAGVKLRSASAASQATQNRPSHTSRGGRFAVLHAPYSTWHEPESSASTNLACLNRGKASGGQGRVDGGKSYTFSGGLTAIDWSGFGSSS
jgi:hypothetical protein